MNIKIETPRLLLSEFQNTDASFIIDLLNAPTWIEHIGDRNIRTITDAEKYIDSLRKSYSEYGFGFYKVVLKTTDEPIGLCGIIKRPSLDDVDIGFAMLPKFAGQGYGTEAGTATFTYAQNVGLKRLVAITTEANVYSQKLLAKIGLSHEKMIDFGEEKLMLFSVNFA